MRRPRPQETRGTLPGRLVLLVVLFAGFLTMHGFLAVSASADAHGTEAVPAGASAPTLDGHAAVHPAGAPAAADARQPGLTDAPSPSPHPAEHHGLLAGCVVALVGVAGLALAHLLVRHRPLPAGGSPVTVRRVLSWVGDHAPAPPPPRIALCVIRV